MGKGVAWILFPFFSWAGLVSKKTVVSDFFAGITNAFVVLPQSVAFAMIAGLPPEYGLYTAIVPPIIAALFGSSFHLISGPTTAISIVIFSTISPYAEAGTGEFIMLTFTLTFLAGLIQFVLGISRMGGMVNFISHTVVIGFTAGAAILIATSQIKHCFGIKIPQGESFLHTMLEIAKTLPETNPYSLAVAVITVATIVLLKKIAPKIPNLLFAMIAGSIAAILFGAEQNGIRLVGSIPSKLPPFSMPNFEMSALRSMSSGAFAVAMLGLIEAVSIARSISIKSQQRINGNQEFIGQGLSNIVGSFFSCYASSGSFTRSGINYEAGARTPMAAIFAALSLALILIFVAPLAAYLPIPAMGGIVLVVAYNLIDFRHIRAVFKASASESAVLVITFLSTLFVELEFAIYVGIIFSMILYLNKTSKPRIISSVPDQHSEKRPFATDLELPRCDQFKILRIDGSIYFGSVNHIEESLEAIHMEKPGYVHLLIIATGINFVDIAGAEMLANEGRRRKMSGGGLYFYGVKKPVLEILEKGGYLDVIGKENFFVSKSEAISTITKKVDKNICEGCTEKIFLECSKNESS